MKRVWDILKYPHLTEKSIGLVEKENKLVFIVDNRATKSEVKWAVEKGFNVKVLKVNILNDMKGRKKAFVKLHPDNNALDIATRLGML
ncbi:MAG: 50S ribosomal protein L23 [Candidatus Aenigmatarchaeota archaeon]|nr:MAG: 50S ribosomal protein L23 [Candidatus Aenigmarchaeota archaeon]